ncbi:hypothetical protein WJX84_008740 [Apatococcus fuscideae]|uniref:Uncharacterized protein n=1 Tax=Apatococcus fuscideae TaxID=2026836 RepID=A0AAW1RSW2_9CHLO
MPPAASLCKASALETLWAIVAEYSEDGGHRNLQAAMATSAKLMTDDKGRVAMFSAWAAEIQSQQWHHSLLLRVQNVGVNPAQGPSTVIGPSLP